jgi:cyclohexyl-isocyanide hydratase
MNMSSFTVGFVLFPDLTQLDLTGPLQVLARLAQSRTVVAAKSESAVPSDCGLPTHSFANCPPFDLICVPGGVKGVIGAIGDRATVDFVRRQAASAKYITSVCTGAFVLGVAGLLQGRRATTHWGLHRIVASSRGEIRESKDRAGR